MTEENQVSNRIATCIAGTLLGTALGDALGLPLEGLSNKQIARRYGEVNSFHFAGSLGYVSDDTEQSALLARAIALNPEDAEACAVQFKKSLLGWFLRIPCAIGMATIRACLNILFQAKQTGINSAGNGSAIRAAIIGVFFHESFAKRKEFGTAVCKITHTDARAIAAALFVAELAAACTRNAKKVDCKTCFNEALATVENQPLKEKLQLAAKLAEQNVDMPAAANELKNTGFVLHCVPLSAFCFLRFGDGDVSTALSRIISAGGDTDSNAAILGAWLGAKRGESALNTELVNQIVGPFGTPYLRRLAKYLSRLKRGDVKEEDEEVDYGDDSSQVPGYNWGIAIIHNITFLCLILIHICIRAVFFVKEAIQK